MFESGVRFPSPAPSGYVLPMAVLRRDDSAKSRLGEAERSRTDEAGQAKPGSLRFSVEEGRLADYPASHDRSQRRPILYSPRAENRESGAGGH